MARRRARRRGNAPEINVTPLVDVVLVLLIIFMVIAPQLEQGVRVELPGVANPDPKTASGLDPVTLTVTADGQLFLEKEPVAREALAGALTDAHRQEPERRLVLKADQALPYGQARRLFVAGQDAGFPGVALLVGDKARRGGEGD